MTGIPLIILSHRKRAFLETALASIKEHGRGVGQIIVVDDSGEDEHHRWLDSLGVQYTVVDTRRNRGYLEAMQMVFDVAAVAADYTDEPYALLWEEDFIATRKFDVRDMAAIMDATPRLAQLNLQRQAVYRVEKRFGYLESHVRRGYWLTRECSGYKALPWIKRARPFTTNPGLIRREVLDIDWPSRELCDLTPGGAEPAMSTHLECLGWHFGWYGEWNQPYTEHLGTTLKTGSGY